MIPVYSLLIISTSLGSLYTVMTELFPFSLHNLEFSEGAEACRIRSKAESGGNFYVDHLKICFQ